MGYELLFSIYGLRIKPERKCCWLQIYAGVISLYVGCPIVVGLNQCIDELSVNIVLFYNHFHYRICFNDFRYEIRF